VQQQRSLGVVVAHRSGVARDGIAREPRLPADRGEQVGCEGSVQHLLANYVFDRGCGLRIGIHHAPHRVLIGRDRAVFDLDRPLQVAAQILDVGDRFDHAPGFRGCYWFERKAVSGPRRTSSVPLLIPAASVRDRDGDQRGADHLPSAVHDVIPQSSSSWGRRRARRASARRGAAAACSVRMLPVNTTGGKSGHPRRLRRWRRRANYVRAKMRGPCPDCGDKLFASSNRAICRNCGLKRYAKPGFPIERPG
jgi:hypothetical protein